MTQSLVIPNFLPAQLANGPHEHWATKQSKKREASSMVRMAAMLAKWTPVPGRVRLDITFVFPQKRRRDYDNLVARTKGLLDGLKGRWFEDDDLEHLDLHVTAIVEPKVKETRITLQEAAK